MDGMFISFEGGEGSGKTTIIDSLVKELEALGYEVVRTREPGGVPIAEEIRDIILDCKNTKMCNETETLLYAASRMQHLHEKVIPVLKKGGIVICDRYLDSSLVYQGYARGIGFDGVMKANCFALDYMPNLTFFIDVTPEVGLSRLSNRAGKIDRLDKESISFHQKVYDGYIKLLEMYPERIKRIDGNREKTEVYAQVLAQTVEYLKK